MDFEQQKPITDAFRDGWERTFGVQANLGPIQCKDCKGWFDHDEYCGHICVPTYVSGCPILPEGPQRDDL